jgi:hypothetical protein
VAEPPPPVTAVLSPNVTTLELERELVPSPTAIPLLKPESDRRNWTDRNALVRRVESEFKEMPGLSLTLAQAVRLFSVPQGPCERILSVLVKDGAVSLRNDGSYARHGTSSP